MKPVSFALALVLGASALVGSCRSASEEGTSQTSTGTGALVLAVSTDVTAADLQELEIGVLEDGTALIFAATYKLPTEASLPGTLTLVASSGGAAGPEGSLSPGVVRIAQPSQTLTLTVRGTGAFSIERSAVLTMPTGGVKRLDLRLEQGCAGVVCKAKGQTCIGGGCAPSSVDTATLPTD